VGLVLIHVLHVLAQLLHVYLVRQLITEFLQLTVLVLQDILIIIRVVKLVIIPSAPHVVL